MRTSLFSGLTACIFLTGVLGLSGPAMADDDEYDDDDGGEQSNLNLCYAVTAIEGGDEGELRLRMSPPTDADYVQVAGVWIEEENVTVASPVDGALVRVVDGLQPGVPVVKMVLTESFSDGPGIVSAAIWHFTFNDTMTMGEARSIQIGYTDLVNAAPGCNPCYAYANPVSPVEFVEVPNPNPPPERISNPFEIQVTTYTVGPCSDY